MSTRSNERAKQTWEVRPVGGQRSSAPRGTKEWFEQIRAYRYGYETPFIPRLFDFDGLQGKRVLEIGVGLGIDAVEMASRGAIYTGIDITRNHLELTRRNFELNLPGYEPRLIESDLLESDLQDKFDVIYSFGVLHHIEHEAAYLQRIHELLSDTGTLRIALYSKFSFFNAYLVATWLTRQFGRTALADWQSHLAEHSELGKPVTIRIRSKREIQRMLAEGNFEVSSYAKRGFVKNYLPGVGQMLDSDGPVLNTLGAALGWYHILECRKAA
jgi:2-polyprenyl-3-methyl-5-hydroxy-6-metoxy-1,4-benzoquinol methylase